MRYLLILFIAMPIIEIGMFIRVGGWLGMWPTLLIVVLTAVLGTWMLRQQGASTMMQAQQRLSAGELPAQQIIEGFLLLVGGVLLLTPGFVTDGIGFACLIPWSRRWFAQAILSRSNGGAVFMNIGGSSVGGATGRGNAGMGGLGGLGGEKPAGRPSGQAGEPRRPRVDDVIEGDYREID